jgi:Holliday junction DNA helicase RuvA
MIAFLEGEVSEKFAGSVVLKVGGVGYEVAVSTIDFDQLVVGETVKLYTFHYVREQSEELFGFTTLAAKRLFELLISVQGVGPKAALAIMSLDSAEAVRNALANANSGFIGQASGVGKKTAERVVLELSDKVGTPSVVGQISAETPKAVGQKDEAAEALMSLGYTLAEATDALKNVAAELTVEERITLALKK